MKHLFYFALITFVAVLVDGCLLVTDFPEDPSAIADSDACDASDASCTVADASDAPDAIIVDADDVGVVDTGDTSDTIDTRDATPDVIDATDAGDVSDSGDVLPTDTDTGSDVVDVSDADVPDSETDADAVDVSDTDTTCQKVVWYQDRDGDGHGDMSVNQLKCRAPTGPNGNPYVRQAGDCNDQSALVHPGATETCNGTDDDCDGNVDNGVQNTYYADNDADSFGDPTSQQMACSKPNGYVTNDQDCDDGNGNVHPNASEVCNGTDDDCNGQTDEGLPTQTYYADTDTDGYGDPNATQTDCQQPSGYVANSDDCDDNEPTVHKDGIEAGYDSQGNPVNHCSDGLNNDCDPNGYIDGQDPACKDVDNDGFPDGADAIYATDTTGNGNNDTVCIKAALAMGSPHNASAVIYHGQAPGSGWGGFSAPLPSGQTDGLNNGEWCHTFTSEPTGSYRYRYVSTLGQNGQSSVNTGDCNDWVVMQPMNCINGAKQAFNTTAEAFCYQWNGSNACGLIGTVIRLEWDATTGTITTN